MLTTPKGFTDDLQDQMAEFYATHSYDEPPKDYMEQTEDTPNDDEDEGGRGSSDRQRLELARWERKALRLLARHGSPLCEFESDALDEGTVTAVSSGLAHAKDAAEVRAVFAENLEDLFPSVYYTTQQQYERQQIARKWRERRLAAEREG